MSISSSKHKVRSLYDAFDYACSTLGMNATTFVFNRDYKAKQAVVTQLREMGQTHLINLSHKYTDGAIALPFYAGDGIVAKVMRHSDYDKSRPIYNVPAISSEKVDTEYDTFVINTYPWIPGGYVSQDDVEELRVKMQSVGLDFSEKDDNPRNFHRMPDAHHTLVGIDADMYTWAKNGNIQPTALGAAWIEYMETIFPIYKEGKVPAQTADTNFQFRSIHDRESGIIGFDSDRFLVDGKSPIITNIPKLAAKQSLWGHIFGSWGRKHDKQEPDGPEPDSFEPS